MKTADLEKFVEHGAMLHEHTIRRPYTLVSVTFIFGKTPYIGIGMARCSVGDAWSDGVGFDWALGRAKAEVAKQVRQELKFREKSRKQRGG